MQVCDTCHAFKIFGRKCWFYWEDKKQCSQYREGPQDEPRVKSVL